VTAEKPKGEWGEEGGWFAHERERERESERGSEVEREGKRLTRERASARAKKEAHRLLAGREGHGQREAGVEGGGRYVRFKEQEGRES